MTHSDGEQRFRLSCFEYSGEKPPGCYGVVLVPDEENGCVYLMGGTNGHEYYYDVYRGNIQEMPNGNFHVAWERISVSILHVEIVYPFLSFRTGVCLSVVDIVMRPFCTKINYCFSEVETSRHFILWHL